MVPMRTLQRITVSELNSESKIEKIILFGETTLNLYGDSMSVIEITDTNDVKDKDLMVYEYEETRNIPDEDPMDATGKAIL